MLCKFSFYTSQVNALNLKAFLCFILIVTMLIKSFTGIKKGFFIMDLFFGINGVRHSIKIKPIEKHSLTSSSTSMVSPAVLTVLAVFF